MSGKAWRELEEPQRELKGPQEVAGRASVAAVDPQREL